MEQWTEVTDVQEIERLNREFVSKLKKSTTKGNQFRIGTPGGHFDADVRLAPISTRKEFWTYSHESRKTGDFVTAVGCHAPGQSGPLSIDLQFNFPKGRFTRQKGGAFVKDSAGRTFLAHRGIVTRGNSRVQKAELLRHISRPKLIVANSKVKPGNVELLLVAALDDERLITKIWRFASAVRDAADLATRQEETARPHNSQLGLAKKDETENKKKFDLILSTYWDEFSGTRVMERKNEVTATWSHGSVVNALSKEMRNQGDLLKCQAADLIVRSNNTIDLFEVKVTSGSQSIYTAIGQLVFNGLSLEQEFRSHTVRKFLVLPSASKQEARQNRCKELGFNLITFEANGAGFEFRGLPHLPANAEF